MAKFMILLHDSPKLLKKMGKLDTQGIKDTVGRYQRWGQNLAKEGKLLGAEKLKLETGRVLLADSSLDSLKVTEGPYSQSGQVMGGFFLIDAENYDQAVTLCENHPQIAEGGIIEIRQIDQM